MQLKQKDTRYSDTRGFTLVEMLVAVFIFTIVVVAMFNLFMIAQKAQRTAAALENLQDDMRFSLNHIAEDVRDGSIDYAYYAANPTVGTIDANKMMTTSELAIRTFGGASMHIKKGTGPGECLDPAVSPGTKKCLLIQENADALDGDPAKEWHSMTSDGVSTESLMFYITPAVDPFIFNETTKKYDADSQPRVRIVLSGSAKVRQKDTRVSVSLQTLISTREYRR